MIDQPPAEVAAAPVREAGVEPGPLGELRAAIGVLTRIPVTDKGTGTGAAAFGLVGGFIGAAGAIPVLAVGGLVPTVAAILAIATMAALSGAIHLDGLADTADALVAVGPDAGERARKDPAVGAAGAVTLILVLGLEVAALTALLVSAGTIVAAFGCVIAAAASRAVPSAVARFAARSTTSHGLGAWFAARVSDTGVVVAFVTVLAIAGASALATARGELLVAGIAGLAVGVGGSVGLARVRHQVDGDLLGAGVELGQAACLVTAAVLVAWRT